MLLSFERPAAPGASCLDGGARVCQAPSPDLENCTAGQINSSNHRRTFASG